LSSFGFLSTYPPTRCGLATFTASLATAMVGPGDIRAHIVRVMDDLAGPPPVLVGSRSVIVGELHAGDAESIRDAAKTLSSSDAVIVQHEYGIYGGPDGDEVLEVLARLTAPTIVVLHTVLATPTAGQRRVLERVTEESSAVVVMSETARRLLAERYRVDQTKVSVIPHGVPEWVAVPAIGHPDHRTMLTWGLIGPGKGIEWGIRAMVQLAEVDPSFHYVIAGQTHPKVLAHEGERYRESLQRLIDDSGLSDRVTLDDRYLDPAQLAAQVSAAEIVLLPYDSRDQVTSGVLAEAVAAGKQVVATGFPHALDLLGGGVGTVVAHEDPAAIAQAVTHLLTRPHRVRKIDLRHGVFGADASWSAVAAEYRRLSDSIQAARSA
jgi:glycosyltransferase involved in cell wall biosynthesis